MRSARDLRLESDHASVVKLAEESGGTLTVEETRGRPPDHYVLGFHCRTIERLDNGKPIYRTLNRVEIRLPAKYPAPFAAPKVRMLTPIWHPHVYKNLAVCMGDWRTSEYLDAFVLRLGALLQFEKEFFDVRDPANEEAVDWARKNLILFPTDTCTFRRDTSRVRAEPGGYVPLMQTSTPLREPEPEPESEHPYILWEDID